MTYQEEIDKALKAGVHRVGSHSDDYGGEADMPCDCALKKAISTLIEQEVRKGKISELKSLSAAAHKKMYPNGIEDTIDDRLFALQAEEME